MFQIIKIFHPTVKPSTTQCERFFFHAILVIKWDKLLKKLIKGFDVPTEQPILRQLICFCLNCSKKETTVQPLVRLPYDSASLFHCTESQFTEFIKVRIILNAFQRFDETVNLLIDQMLCPRFNPFILSRSTKQTFHYSIFFFNSSFVFLRHIPQLYLISFICTIHKNFFINWFNFVRFTGTETPCINLGSYNYLGFAEATGQCAEDSIKTLKKFGCTTCSPRLELGKFRISLHNIPFLLAEHQYKLMWSSSV